MRLKDEAASTRKRALRKPGLSPGIGGAANESLSLRNDDTGARATRRTEESAVSSRGDEGPRASSEGDFYRLMDDGFGFYRCGDLKAARERWEKAAKLKPHDRAVQFNLRKLAETEKEEAVRAGSETLH
jgi:hypothetical protein